MKDGHLAVMFMLLFLNLATCVINGYKSNSNRDFLSSRLGEIEGKIMLHDGKAILTNGEVCMITNETLKDEELAVQLVRACVKAYSERSVEP